MNEEILRLTSSHCLFLLDPILFSPVFFFFFEERREEGLFFFPDDVFKKNDGKRSSRGDLSSDFCSSGRMTLCRVTHKRCVTR